jgi:hypothetical protein
MIASMFNLDHRLAELLETDPARHVAATRELRPSASRAARTTGAIRSLFGRRPVADRPAGLAA